MNHAARNGAKLKSVRHQEVVKIKDLRSETYTVNLTPEAVWLQQSCNGE